MTQVAKLQKVSLRECFLAVKVWRVGLYRCWCHKQHGTFALPEKQTPGSDLAFSTSHSLGIPLKRQVIDVVSPQTLGLLELFSGAQSSRILQTPHIEFI